jgi:hypothetical protein
MKRMSIDQQLLENERRLRKVRDNNYVQIHIKKALQHLDSDKVMVKTKLLEALEELEKCMVN